MAKRPMESLKETANRLARLICSGSTGKEKISVLKQELGLDDPGSDRENPGITGTPGPGERIGIWIPALIDGKKYYIRDLKYRKDFNDWARVPRIPPKSNKKRIVYLGESVSRGYLLDPFYTPASVLESLLNLKPEVLEAEVVDLAQTNCRIDELTELCQSCTALQPDALVIFAGNNWINCFELSEPLVEEILRIIEMKERFKGLNRFLEEQYRDRIGRFMELVDNLSKTHQIPVVFVIPEFNLKDFQSHWAQQINIWPRGETGEWLSLKNRVEGCIEKGEIERAEELSRKMIELNEGNPLGWELLARCCLERDSFSEGTEYLRRALDTAIFRDWNAPCCISVIHDTIMREAARYHMPMVDLAVVFSENLGGRPPDRHLFLDYCHLSVEGIRWSMASTAQQVFSVLVRENIALDILKEAAPEPDEYVWARAHFFAAVHNAHRGEQPYELLYYHCLQALEKSMKVKDLMLNYIQMAVRRTAWSLTKECEKLFVNGEIEQFPLILQPHNRYIMDIDLVDAVVEALKEFGIDVSDRVLALRKEEHGTANGKINLLDSYYHLKSYVASCRPYDSYYRALAPQSNFFLVTGKDNDIKLELTCRVPGNHHGEKKVCLKVNGSELTELSAQNCWQGFSLEIGAELLIDGINTITVHWPPDVDYRETLTDLRKGSTTTEFLQRTMYPPSGEIYMFTAQRSDEQERRK